MYRGNNNNNDPNNNINNNQPNNLNMNNNNQNNQNNINNLNNIINNVNNNIGNIDKRFNEKNQQNQQTPMDIDSVDNNKIKQIVNNNQNPNHPNNQNNQNNNFSQIDDSSIMDEINQTHDKVKLIFSTRKKTLEKIAFYCLEKDVPSTLNYLEMLKEQAMFHDFLNYSLLQADPIRIPLTLDNCTLLLVHVISLINAKYPNYKKVGINCALVLLKLFMERIISTKNAITTNGIDLSREDRIKKCDKIIEHYINIARLEVIENIMVNKEKDEVSDYLIRIFILFYLI